MAPLMGVFCAQKQQEMSVQTQMLGRFIFELWPARSPNLNFLDFYVWGYLKSIVYATAVNGVTELQQRLNMGEMRNA
jgi:hypothetical protein